MASFGGVTVPACAYGEPSPSSVPWTTDQFGNSGLDNYGRMLGPRYPHSWSRVMTRQCEDYLVFFNNYTTTPPVITHRLFISVFSLLAPPPFQRSRLSRLHLPLALSGPGRRLVRRPLRGAPRSGRSLYLAHHFHQLCCCTLTRGWHL